MCNEVDNNFVVFITHQLISTYNIIYLKLADNTYSLLI